LNMITLLEKMKPLVDKTIDSIADGKFPEDPIGGKYSRVSSVVQSAYKRHGLILEKTILAHMQSINKFKAWEDREFWTPEKAIRAATDMQEDLRKDGDYERQEFKYNSKLNEKNPGSTHLQVDLFVYNKKEKSLNSYEIKRGGGHHDSGKQKSIVKDLLITETLLKSYGENNGLKVNNTKSYIIFFYAGGTLGKKPNKHFKLEGKDLDQHFNSEVFNNIETVNNYFKKKLHEMLE